MLQSRLFLRSILKKETFLPKIQFQVIPKVFMVSVQFLMLFIKRVLRVHWSGYDIVVAYRFNHFAWKTRMGTVVCLSLSLVN